ncbi:MAG: PIN domain-containing protein [Candidatus Altiarchaeota archaeon]|nr:PIN domain-containing protein [Candidatus Altiarchaeota archaeon]
MKCVFDTSVIIKGLIKPRRRKNDAILAGQLDAYKSAAELMNKVHAGEISLIIPTAAIIEVAAVSSRLTGIKEVGVKAADFIGNIAAEIVCERDILTECIDVAATTRAGGFDSAFIACAKTTSSTLFTDDKGMYDAARRAKINAQLLRNID